MNIGVVGIGKMGTPIATRLLSAGHEVSICSRSRTARVDALEERGATVCASPAGLAEGAEVILTALPTEDAVRDVFAAMSEVARRDQLYVDHSTVSITLNRWCADSLSNKDASFLDAPVSGGPSGAESGKLTVMVGGDQDAYSRALPVFEQYGSKIRLCGPVGSGQAIKLVNQMLVALHTMAASEAAAFAVSIGADLETVQDVIGTSFGSSAMLLRNLPRYISRDFSPATPIGLIAKDLSIIHKEAAAAGTPLLLTGLVEQFYLEAKARGWTDQDMAALLKFWDRQPESSSDSSLVG